MARRRRRNPWVSTGEVLAWVLFALLLFPVGFAGWAVGHYTSLGKSGGTTTVTVGAAATTAAATTAAATTTAAPATTSAKTTTSAAGATAGDATKGKAIFAAQGCASCHTFKPAGSTGTIGPNLDTKPAQDAKKDGNMPLLAFIKQSIVDPNAYISSGYPKSVMPSTYGTQLSKAQIADLVAFLAAGATK